MSSDIVKLTPTIPFPRTITKPTPNNMATDFRFYTNDGQEFKLSRDKAKQFGEVENMLTEGIDQTTLQAPAKVFELLYTFVRDKDLTNKEALDSFARELYPDRLKWVGIIDTVVFLDNKAILDAMAKLLASKINGKNEKEMKRELEVDPDEFAKFMGRPPPPESPPEVTSLPHSEAESNTPMDTE